MLHQSSRKRDLSVKAASPSDSARLSRRELFARSGSFLYGTALASILGKELFPAHPLLASTGQSNDLRPRTPHFDPKAKAVIHLFMNGGPSQVDLFDPKPLLQKYAGTVPNRDLTSDITSPTQSGGLLPSPYRFSRHGQSGMELSELLPHLATCVDDIALIRSMYGAHFNHEPAIFFMQSGRTVASRPSVGAWVAYGLGTENRNLPAYVVLDDPKGLPVNGISNWQSAWLPPVYQGTRFRSEGPPVLNLDPRPEWPASLVKAQRALLQDLDRAHRRQRPHEPYLEGRIASYELAARMQLAASDALDLSQETEPTREMYGLNREETASYGKRCLMARRLVERGVRFVQLYIESQIWDAHEQSGQDVALQLRQDRPTRGRPADGSQAAGPAGFHPGGVGRRVRTPAAVTDPGLWRRGPRPRPQRLQCLDGGGRHQGRHHLRRHRRVRTQGRGEPGQRPRFPRHHPAPAGHEFPRPGLRAPRLA